MSQPDYLKQFSDSIEVSTKPEDVKDPAMREKYVPPQGVPPLSAGVIWYPEGEIHNDVSRPPWSGMVVARQPNGALVIRVFASAGTTMLTKSCFHVDDPVLKEFPEKKTPQGAWDYAGTWEARTDPQTPSQQRATNDLTSPTEWEAEVIAAARQNGPGLGVSAQLAARFDVPPTRIQEVLRRYDVFPQERTAAQPV